MAKIKDEKGLCDLLWSKEFLLELFDVDPDGTTHFRPTEEGRDVSTFLYERAEQILLYSELLDIHEIREIEHYNDPRTHPDKWRGALDGLFELWGYMVSCKVKL